MHARTSRRTAALMLLAAAAYAADLPRPAMDITIQFPDGTSRQLSSYKGKVVVLEFLYTT